MHIYEIANTEQITLLGLQVPYMLCTQRSTYPEPSSIELSKTLMVAIAFPVLTVNTL